MEPNFGAKREIIESEPEMGTYRATYDYPDEPPSTAVPLALMELTGCAVTDLEPLQDATSVDMDALDELFSPTASGGVREATVTFDYHDYEVVVKGYGRIVIRETDSQRVG